MQMFTSCSQKLKTKASKLHTWFWQQQTKTRNVSFLLSTIGKGGTRIWTRDLLICSQMLYRWAIPPKHPVKKLNKIIYILHWKKASASLQGQDFDYPKIPTNPKGAPGFELGTSSCVVKCSTTELYLMHSKQKQGNYILDFDNINSLTLNVPNIPSQKGAAGFEPVNLLICLGLKSRLWVFKEFTYLILTTSNINSFTSKSGLWFFQNPPKSKVKNWGPPFLKILSSSTEKKSVWQKINNNSLVLKLIFPKFATLQGAPGFEPGTSWSAVKCSTTELYPHEIESIT